VSEDRPEGGRDGRDGGIERPLDRGEVLRKEKRNTRSPSSANRHQSEGDQGKGRPSRHGGGIGTNHSFKLQNIEPAESDTLKAPHMESINKKKGLMKKRYIIKYYGSRSL